MTIEEDDDPLRFRIGNAYLNLLPGEQPTPRHISWRDICPDDCEAALFTSLFPERSYEWLRSVSPKLKRALVIADRCPAPANKPPPSLDAPDGDGWRLLQGQRKSGIVHCSLLLFRTPGYLRVACGGTNLEGQFEVDRDSLFVQDFPIVDGACPDDSPFFGEPLAAFLAYLPYAGLPSAQRRDVDDFCDELISDVDFRAASGALVTCMPGRDEGKGGWRMLQEAIAGLRAPRLEGGRVDIATGHFGTIHLPFLASMATTLRGQATPAKGGEWAAIGTAFLYHSSRATVLRPGTNAFAVLRTTAPGDREGARTDPTLLQHHFHDAVPKFERARPAAAAAANELTPILHGKALLATAADGAGGVLFVGSQNFSRASWGEGGQQPTNVELGVVLAAHTTAGVGELRARFPIELAPAADFGTAASQRGYVMARGPTDGNNQQSGLQFRWRARCNDLGQLPAWRLFLHRWWGMCSRCRAPGVPADWDGAYTEAGGRAIEELATRGSAFLCAECASASAL